MFLFLQFIIDNISAFADVHALCLTSTKSIEFMTRYYRCAKPMALPFPCSRLQQKGASAWDKFTNYLMSKSEFREPSEHRMRFCIMLDFFKATRHPFAAVRNPFEFVIHFNQSAYVNKEIVRLYYNRWVSKFDLGPDMPFHFYMWIPDPSCDYELYGIVFTELEYMSQFKYCFDLRTGGIYNRIPFIYFYKAHVVQTLGYTYVIVFLRRKIYMEARNLAKKRIQARFDVYGADAHETIDARIKADTEAFTNRFHKK